METKQLPLKNYRQLNLTQSQLAEKAGLTQGRISQLIRSGSEAVIQVNGSDLKIVTFLGQRTHGRSQTVTN